jgi:hypothetical protein
LILSQKGRGFDISLPWSCRPSALAGILTGNTKSRVPNFSKPSVSPCTEGLLRTEVLKMPKTINKICNDYSKENPLCVLCEKVFIQIKEARLVRCTWLPKKINVKLAQQKLF